MNQRQWLNVIIIVISALILLFMLIGRFMSKAVDEAEQKASEQQNIEAVEEQQKKGQKDNKDNRY